MFLNDITKQEHNNAILYSSYEQQCCLKRYNIPFKERHFPCESILEIPAERSSMNKNAILKKDTMGQALMISAHKLHNIYQKKKESQLVKRKHQQMLSSLIT